MMNGTAPLEERLDFLDRCTRCSQCKFVPTPQSQKHASACPSMDFVEYHAGSASGQLIMASGIAHGEFGYSPGLLDTMSACTMCGTCDVSCKINFGESVEPLDGLYALRARVVDDGQSPKRHRELMDKVRTEGNSAGHPRAARGTWAEGLDLGRQGDVLLHIGSTLAYDTNKHAALRAIVQTLQAAGIRVCTLAQDEGSCGALAFDLGYQAQSRELARTFLSQLAQSGARTVVTFSSSAIAAYRSFYPRMGLSFGDVKPLHITEYLQQQVAAGVLALIPSPTRSGQTVAFHDTCKSGRLSEPWERKNLKVVRKMGGYYASEERDTLLFGNGGNYEAPRELLKRMGIDVTELERNRAASYCCGATGGVKETVPAAAKMAAQNRLSELQGTGTDVMVSACGNCAHHLGKHTKGQTTVVDLIDLLAESLRPVHTGN
jgi:Fe-S oxidoreductase